MSAQHAMFDTAGPRARRTIRIVTAVTVLFIAGLAALVYWGLYDSGALAPSKWRTFTEPGTISYFGTALANTGRAALGAAAIAVPLGLVLALGRLSGLAVLRIPSTIVIEFFRAVPVLLVIFVFMFALPSYGINLSNYQKLVIPIGLCTAAVLAEVFRAGVLAIPQGQLEAGLSLGMTRGLGMRLIVLPQAIRIVVPALVAQAVIVVKDTAFGYVVSYSELMQSARVLVANTGDLVQTYLVVTVIYVIINIAISRGAQWLDSHLGKRAAGGGRRRLPALTGRRFGAV